MSLLLPLITILTIPLSADSMTSSMGKVFFLRDIDILKRQVLGLERHSLELVKRLLIFDR